MTDISDLKPGDRVHCTRPGKDGEPDDSFMVEALEVAGARSAGGIYGQDSNGIVHWIDASWTVTRLAPPRPWWHSTPGTYAMWAGQLLVCKENGFWAGSHTSQSYDSLTDQYGTPARWGPIPDDAPDGKS